VAAGEIRQGPFRYEITDASGEGWTFWHYSAAGSFTAVDVYADRPTNAEVAEAHRALSTPPDRRFTRVLIVLRRDDTGTGALREIRHQRTGDGAFTCDLASYDEWRPALESLCVSLAASQRMSCGRCTPAWSLPTRNG
jgi:N-hydroxyarylamine O-acetyltransferase